MPFNIGAFEVIVLVFVIGVICISVTLFILVIPRMAKVPTKRTQGQDVIAVEELHNLIEQGWRIDSESSDYIFLVKGQRVNHLLHFLVGLFTIGVWWMVWIFIAAYGGEERRTVKKSSQ